MEAGFGWRVCTEADTYIVWLWGELDVATADEFEQALVEAGGSQVVIDLGALTFIDARGLSALLSARRRIIGAGHGFALRGASGLVRRVFEITDLESLLDD